MTPGEIVIALGARGADAAVLNAIKLVAAVPTETPSPRGERGRGQADAGFLGDLRDLGVDTPW